ncbi:hypothetical protein EW145_g6094 [Phellinidium pouzarii]|uniref:Protein kinase domain-containing protein n=1 Tax=Phellinidium pouzarii TaxID=167371 RepID=A0A4V3XBX9_9AGAM|nr:hypothetical protein EW145_g6094 [Phellinidium pouzarii]
MEFIAKLVRERSNELKVLKVTRNTKPSCPHVISLINSIDSPSAPWVILQKLSPVQDKLYEGSELSGKVVQLCWDLTEGLAYLHEHHLAHLDIKPDNLVYDYAFRLQIIDFDLAIQVENEDTMVNEYRGTRGWSAPPSGGTGMNTGPLCGTDPSWQTGGRAVVLSSAFSRLATLLDCRRIADGNRATTATVVA